MTDTTSLALDLSLLLCEVGLMLLTSLGNCAGEPSSGGDFLNPPPQKQSGFSTVPFLTTALVTQINS